jgi:hypothetical protein
MSKDAIFNLMPGNRIPKLILKVLETPERLISLAFFFVKKFNEGLNEVSTKVNLI